MLITLLESKKDILRDNLGSTAIFEGSNPYLDNSSIGCWSKRRQQNKLSLSFVFTQNQVVCVVWYNLRINKLLKTLPSL